MKWRSSTFLLVFLALFAPIRLSAAELDKRDEPLPVTVAAESMSPPDGFQVSLFAGEPDVVQPIAMTFDRRGRMWVVECLSYPQWTDDGTGHDRVTILEDTDGDGRHDKRTVFLDDGANLTGIELGHGGVWLTSTPNLIFVPDHDGDDRPDGPPEVLLDGWDLTARHNVSNGLIWGPDGWLYGCNGILSNSRVGPPGTPDDQRTLLNCGVWRYHPTRKVFDVVASGSTNPWGLDFDDYGQAFITNCVIKHIFHVVPGAHYERMFGQDLNPYAYTLLPSCADHIHWGGGHWTESRSGAAHDDAGGGHAHSGCAIYLGDNFPAEYRNNVFMANIHGSRLNRDSLTRSGAGYVAQHETDFLHANDPWFRGIAVKCGPDGALYVTDWTDTGECHNYEVADKTNGRIYRITHGADVRLPSDLNRASDSELVDLQASLNEWQVRQARRLLSERASTPEKSMAILKLLDAMAPQNDREALRQLWARYAVGGIAAIQSAGAFEPSAPEWVRFWAIQLAADVPGSWTPELLLALESQYDHSTSLIRRGLASTCQYRIRSGNFEEARGILQRLVTNTEDAQDPLLQALNWYALEPLVAEHPDLVLEWLPDVTMPLVRTLIARRMVGTDQGFDRLSALWRSEDDADWYYDTLQGVLTAFAGVESLPMPEEWGDTYARLQAHTNPEVQHAGKMLGTLFGDSSILEGFRATLSDPTQETAQRLTALDVLLTRKAPQMESTLRGLLDDPKLRPAVIRGLLSVGGDTVPPLLLKHYASVSPSEQQEIIQGLTTRLSFAEHLLAAIEQSVVPRHDVSALIIRQLQALKDSQITHRLSEVWGEVRPVSESKLAVIEAYRQEFTTAALAQADLAVGREVFLKSCAACHRLFDEGGTIGPDLTGSQRANLDYLLDNILDPSAIVPTNYRVTMLLLNDGRILQGVITEEDQLQITLQTATETILVPHKNLEERRASQLSMMPERILEYLPEQERRDLIAYLQSPVGTQPAAESEAANDRADSVEQWHLLDPAWDSEVIHGESVTLLQGAPGGPLVGRLAYPVAELIEVRTSNRTHTYNPRTDFQVDAATGRITFPSDFDVPFITTESKYPAINSPNSYKHRVGHPEQALLYGPGRWFHDHQIEVTYRPLRNSSQSKRFAESGDLLPRTLERLKSGKPLVIGVSGDSISAGGDASGLNDVAPHQPAFPELVQRQLESSYDSEITMKNRAVGGWSIANGLTDLDALLAEKPDLIIFAYGMNDVGRRDPAWFRERTEEFLSRVKTADPTIEIIMVTPMLGNIEWIHTPREMFFKYRDVQANFVGPGVAFADLTAVWEELLHRKNDLDLTGNGLNHPNDFGHRLYAQTILQLLIEHP
ncbi:PVC-type heme-binding CxxCH protein [Aureliella helgolandensis]|uniref:Cytochrome c n=1 Tax=Aureliella helgolandensis TaxID=2527968 RepID=A0A518GAL8_9BACT|nr:PVC-type heme-binding CxxCH protein [Aureliella helgolandensis]QDV25603.1 Cytochrome c [Aureliella helgolandensis]